MTLEGKVVLITGGRRIGGAVAQELAAHGADIALSYRHSRDAAERTVAAVRAQGRRAELIAADLTRPEACRSVVDTTVQRLGRLDVLIHMGSTYDACPLEEITVAAWQQDHDVTVRAALLCAQAALPHLRHQGGGRIVHVADWLPASGRPAYPGYVSYYTAKAALIALTEALALELAADCILVNAVAPGPILPPPSLSADQRTAVERATPLGRWGGADTVAHAIRLLIESDFITGEVLRVDGGRHLR